MRDGYESSERVVSKSEAEAIVRRLKLQLVNSANEPEDVGPFPKDVAALLTRGDLLEAGTMSPPFPQRAAAAGGCFHLSPRPGRASS